MLESGTVIVICFSVIVKYVEKVFTIPHWGKKSEQAIYMACSLTHRTIASKQYSLL